MLNICCLNAQSLPAHIDEFREFFKLNQYHAIVVTETWLNERIMDEQIALQGYSVLRVDRRGRVGGGVALFLRNGLCAQMVASSSSLPQSDGVPEFLLAEVWTSARPKVLIAAVYRPPKVGFLNIFEEEFAARATCYKFTLILGDFNADLLSSTYDADHLRNFLTSQDLHLVPLQPTHHTKQAHTWIDICAVSDHTWLTSWGQSAQPFLSGHDLIFVSVKYTASRCAPRTFKYRAWSEADQVAAAEVVSSFDLLAFENQPSMDRKVIAFNRMLSDVLERAVPLKEVTVRRSPAPWLSADLRDLKRKRDACYRASKRTGSPVLFARYVDLRREFKKKLGAAKSSHFNRLITAEGNTRRFWKEVGNLGLTRAGNYELPEHISPQVLNTHFASVTTGVSLPQELAECIDVSNPSSECENVNVSECTLSCVDAKNVESAIARVATRAQGVDGFPIQAFKVFRLLLMPLIIALFNFSIVTGVFPSLWKYSLIYPLPKIRNPRISSDFRPISILCAISKVLERIVFNQITCFLQTHDLLCPRQTGFRKGSGTQTAVLRLVDDIRRGIDERMVTVAVFLDFTKAFDTVDHLLLMQKLQSLRFSSGVLKWIHSYLRDRNQAVKVTSGERSEWLPLRSGVPQGSVLGPLLFSIFINDLPRCLAYCSHLLYADDVVVYIQCPPSEIEEHIRLLNADIQQISIWCKANKLQLNETKTKAMIFGSSKYTNRLHFSVCSMIKLDGNIIDLVPTFRYLGVILDSTLSWTLHVSQVRKKVSGALYRIRMNDSNLSVAVKRRLITALVFPFFDYCTVALTNLSKDLDRSLLIAMNNCVRFLLRIPRDVSISRHRRNCGWLQPCNRRLQLIGCAFYKALCLGQAGLFGTQLQLRPNLASRRNPSRTDTLRVPPARTVMYQRSFLISGINFWNSLPPELTSAASLAEFRARCYMYLMAGEERDANLIA